MDIDASSCDIYREYKHEPLQNSQSIRVLKLYPGRAEAPLRGSLLEVYLDHAPKYEAISYTWGSLISKDEIECDSKVIRITQNCSETLRRLRHLISIRLLWIDSICIAQNSYQERNHQVEMMGEIYSKAFRVVVWLGRGDKHTDAAIGYLKSLVQYRKLGFCTNDRLFERRISKVTDRDQVVLNELNSLFEKPWFGRAWTIQEVALSCRCFIMCGRSSIPLKTLMASLRLLQNMTYTLDAIHRAHIHRRLWEHVQDKRELVSDYRLVGFKDNRITNCSTLLLSARYQDASEPRDKIFAFHGLFKRLGVELPIPDYSKPVGQVYREAAAFAIQYDWSLHILSALTGITNVKECPSWVPDWSNNHPISTMGLWKEYPYDVPFFVISADRTILTLKGYIIDTIIERSVAFPDISSIKESAANTEVYVLQEWLAFKNFKNDPSWTTLADMLYRLCKKSWGQTYSSRDLRSGSISFWLLGVRNLKGSSETIDADLNRVAADSARRRRRHRGTPLAIEYLSLAIEQFERLTPLVRKFLDRKVLFRTKGRFGISSMAVDAGDQIAILSGCNSPMIIRRKGCKWRMIAPAYVEDAMDKELLTHHKGYLMKTFDFI